MWRDPMDELIADLEQVVPVTPPRFNDHIPPLEDLQYWAERALRCADAEWDGKHPSEVDPDVRGGVCRVPREVAPLVHAGYV